MNTHSYAAYSLVQVIEAIARMRYVEVEWKDFPNKPYILGSQPIVFHPPGSKGLHVIHLQKMETKCYRNGSLGIILSHYFDSSSSDAIEGFVIEITLYELDEAKGGKSKELVCIQLYSTSKGAKEVSSVGGEYSFDGELIKTRSQLLQAIEFIDGFIGIAPLPPNS